MAKIHEAFVLLNHESGGHIENHEIVGCMAHENHIESTITLGCFVCLAIYHIFRP